MPWKEHARKVDLSIGLEADKSQKTPNVLCNSGPCGCTRGLNETRKHREEINVGLLHTIVERAVLDDRRNEGNVGRNGRHHIGVMGNLADALRGGWSVSWTWGER